MHWTRQGCIHVSSVIMFPEIHTFSNLKYLYHSAFRSANILLTKHTMWSGGPFYIYGIWDGDDIGLEE